jgi:electron transfer flavoprotein alpha subunit
MRIAVCIKQVPVLAAMQFDPHTKTLKREGIPSEVSAFDVRALVKALALRDLHGGEVAVVTMGPPQAREALAECLALGADRALHLCDRAFAGSDTLATARALAMALSSESFDLILCGRNSVDAETGQVGPEMAEFLGLPQVTAAHSLEVDSLSRQFTAERETDDGFERVTGTLPVVVSAAEDLAPERFTSKAQRAAAAGKPCREILAAELSADPGLFGAAGSPTEVVTWEAVETNRLARVIDGIPSEAAGVLAQLLVRDHGLFGQWNVREQPSVAVVTESPSRHGPRGVLVVAETTGDTVRPVTFELLGKASELARALGSSVSLLLMGSGVEHLADSLAAHGADLTLVADDPRLSSYSTECFAHVMAETLQQVRPGIVLLPATRWGRDLAPRVAARLQLGLTGDCIDLGLDAAGHLLQYKPAFGGSIVAPIVSRTLPEMATVRPGMLPLPAPDQNPRARIVRLALPGLPDSRVRVTARQPIAQDAGGLDRADVVVGIGKGVGGPEHLQRLRPLCELLGAVLCATRDVTDAGWLPKQYQVGVTGRAVAPKLYIAVGVRGAFEHMVGVRRAGLVVAINNNPKAPIFKTADYGIVGRYEEVVPALCTHLGALRGGT